VSSTTSPLRSAPAASVLPSSTWTCTRAMALPPSFPAIRPY
jgi:hypothetical protein